MAVGNKQKTGDNFYMMMCMYMNMCICMCMPKTTKKNISRCLP